jgi:hypothetical protein
MPSERGGVISVLKQSPVSLQYPRNPCMLERAISNARPCFMSILAFALLSALNGAPAQDQPAPRVETRSEIRIVRAGGADGPSALDADRDGVVTREEFASPLNSAFDRLDKDRDGRLSAEELAAGGEGGTQVFRSDGREGAPGVMIFGGPGGPAGAQAGTQVFTIRRGGPDGAVSVDGPGRSQVFVRRFGPDGAGDMDKDGDGKVSEAEFLAPLREAFQRMDANGDGLLDEGEHGAPPPPPPAN